MGLGVSVGQIRFVAELDGGITARQNWNPRMLDKNERRQIAKELREIAEAMDRDEFANDCKYVRHEPAKTDR